MAKEIRKNPESLHQTAREVNILFEDCINKGYTAAITSLCLGIGVTFAFKNIHMHLPISYEYKLFICGISTIVISYIAGGLAKRICESNLKKQLLEEASA